VIPLLLVAVSVGLSNLAAAIGIGFGGVTARTRLRVAVVFGAFEAGMPIVGLVIGAGLATGIGHLAGLEIGGRIGAAAGRRSEQIGGAILVAVGLAIAAGAI
jgi:putative Mn2+ efflux pump MntP